MLNTFSDLQLTNVKAVYSGNILSSVMPVYIGEHFKHLQFIADFDVYIAHQTFLSLPDVMMIEVDDEGKCFEKVMLIRNHPVLKRLIIILIGTEDNAAYRRRSLELKVNDYYIYPFPTADFVSRIGFLVKFRSVKPNMHQLEAEMKDTYRMPVSKRVFDIVASSIALLILSPLFVAVAILIKLESKGSVVYKSKRVGAGYRIFDFYKFRSMRSDADQMVQQLADLNQYANEGNKNGKSAFVKFSNDPRITRVGKILRKTSIDELPQLINVLTGDMSLVGNRPLPLYEAEQLTTNKWSTRFNGPAGLTGLWQISRRGKKDMSESERKELDNYYANHYSIFLDFKIILKTIPALIQKEDV